jgi:hypothetical protein
MGVVLFIDTTFIPSFAGELHCPLYLRTKLVKLGRGGGTAIINMMLTLPALEGLGR